MFTDVVDNAKCDLESLKTEINNLKIPAPSRKKFESLCIDLTESFKKISQLARDYGKHKLLLRSAEFLDFLQLTSYEHVSSMAN